MRRALARVPGRSASARRCPSSSACCGTRRSSPATSTPASWRRRAGRGRRRADARRWTTSRSWRRPCRPSATRRSRRARRRPRPPGVAPGARRGPARGHGRRRGDLRRHRRRARAVRVEVRADGAGVTRSTLDGARRGGRRLRYRARGSSLARRRPRRTSVASSSARRRLRVSLLRGRLLDVDLGDAARGRRGRARHARPRGPARVHGAHAGQLVRVLVERGPGRGRGPGPRRDGSHEDGERAPRAARRPRQGGARVRGAGRRDRRAARRRWSEPTAERPKVTRRRLLSVLRPSLRAGRAGLARAGLRAAAPWSGAQHALRRPASVGSLRLHVVPLARRGRATCAWAVRAPATHPSSRCRAPWPRPPCCAAGAARRCASCPRPGPARPRPRRTRRGATTCPRLHRPGRGRGCASGACASRTRS